MPVRRVTVSATGRVLSLVTTPGSFAVLSPAMADSSGNTAMSGRISGGPNHNRLRPVPIGNGGTLATTAAAEQRGNAGARRGDLPNSRNYLTPGRPDGG